MATHASPEVRRGQILAAALQCFGEKGYHAARIDDIARCAGLSKGAVYWQFDSKDEIFIALFDAYEAEILAEWDAQDDSMDPLETLRRSGEIVFERLAGARAMADAWAEFLRHEHTRARMAAMYERARERMTAIVERGVASGALRSCSATQVAATLTAVVEGLLLQALVDPNFDPQAVWPQAWDSLSKGLAA